MATDSFPHEEWKITKGEDYFSSPAIFPYLTFVRFVVKSLFFYGP